MYAATQSDDSSEEDRLPKRRRMSPPKSMRGGQSASGKEGPAPASGFAAKMMEKMGYKAGQGLGVDGRGRLAPIESQLRPQGAGLGTVKEKTKQAKEEEKREAAFRGEVREDSSEEEKKRRKDRATKKAQASTAGQGRSTVRAKPKFKTVAEVEAEGLKVPSVLKSIIDATGSEVKVLDSAAGLMTQPGFVLSETEEEKVANRAKRDLSSFTDEWRALKEREDYYLTEGTQLSEDIGKDDEAIGSDSVMLRLARDLQMHPMLNARHNAQSSSWEDAVSRLKPLDETTNSKELASETQTLAVAAIHPLFGATMSQWDPFEDPIGIAPYLDQQKHILGIRKLSSNTELVKQDDFAPSFLPQRATSPYESMICIFWLPKMRTVIMRDWDVKDPSPLIAVLEAWMSILPAFVLAEIVDNLVVQRLTDVISTWNPSKARKQGKQDLALHVWIFPWLQYLDDQHTDPGNPSGLMAEVKRKLKSTLSSWNLAQGLIPGIDKWKTIFGSELKAMFVRYLLPRFRPHMARFEVDPREQEMALLEDVLQWSPFFTPQIMAEFFRTEFFPKWHKSLFIWLSSPSVSYDEVGQWYQWWKGVFEGQFSPLYNEEAPMSTEWQKGLELMLKASELGPAGTAKLAPPQASPDGSDSSRQNNHDRASTRAKETPPPSASRDHNITQTSFKDIVEDWCQENDLLLKPLREADLKTGLPLFRITASASGKGGVIAYIKGDVLWVRKATQQGDQGHTYVPTGLDDNLAGRAEAR